LAEREAWQARVASLEDQIQSLHTVLLRGLEDARCNTVDVSMAILADAKLNAAAVPTVAPALPRKVGWDAEGGCVNCIKVLHGHQAPVVAMAAVGGKLFTASQDGTIRIWEAVLTPIATAL